MVIQASEMESHDSIGVGKLYHAPLRPIFNAIRIDDPAQSVDLTLRLAVRAVNDTMNPDGLVPNLLVYCCLSHFPGREGHT